MAPTRKPRSVNKRISNLNEVSPGKDGVNSNKNKHQKKKLSDKLGSQWSKEELERFYEAYRKYGKDWKKVAAVVCNRSTEMVEALYSMNRAYLSLPQGTASVLGLIAMMTDHYNVLEGSDSERESKDASESRKPIKRKLGKVQHSTPKESVQSQSISSNDGCLSLLKRRRIDGNQPRAVGKRTPRIPISYSYKKDDRESYISPKKRSLKSGVNGNDDEVAHVAALALTEAAQRGGSPLVSQAPYIRTEKSSSVQSWERMHQPSETSRAKFCDASLYEECLEGSVERREPEYKENAKDTSSLMDMEGVDAVEIHQKGKKVYSKRERVENVGNYLFDDGGEACSGTEEGVDVSSLKEKVGNEVANAKPEHLSPKSQRKRSKKLYFGDESSALDKLQTLADLSLMMPASTMEPESSIQLKEERIAIDEDDKSALAETSLTSQSRGKIKLPGPKQMLVHAAPGVEASTRKSMLGRELANDTNNTLFELKEQLHPSDRTRKRKRKPFGSKVSNAKLDSSQHNEPLNDESVVDEESKPGIKERPTDQHVTFPKQLKSVRSSESSLCSDQKDLTVSTAEVQLTNEVSLPTKHSRRKMSIQRTFMQKGKSSENINQPYKYSAPLQDRAFNFKEKLSCCLSSFMVRRWCTFEWFYSAIDYPWFAKREFVEYLNHVGLGNIPRLTRVEWSVIKSSLGKPRRFSDHFLHQERKKLEQYRESVRKHYTELQTGIRDGLPTDLARPLFVGQRVIALHPKAREVHDGSVLTVDHDKCRIQFDHPEVGVEFVMDIDCMPMNPLDNMPEALRRQNGAGKVSGMSKEPLMNGNLTTYASSGSLEKAPNLSSTMVKQGKDDVDCAISQSKAVTIDNTCAQHAAYSQPCAMTYHQAREADIQALYELTRALDKKEALLMELRNANNDILENQNDIDCLRDSESFRKHYATVSSALLHLRQRNTYTGNSLSPGMKAQASFNIHEGLPNTLHSSVAQDLGSTVIEIIKGSRLRAHGMVIAAVQALSSTREGEDAFMNIGHVLDSIENQQLASNSRLPVIRPHEQVNSNTGHNDESIRCASEALHSDASAPKLHNESDEVSQIPSELITSCVATLIMIQTCTERQYPPADVAQILDSAVTSLHPCCPQNLPIYREIQMCMGRIKTQILALIPT